MWKIPKYKVIPLYSKRGSKDSACVDKVGRWGSGAGEAVERFDKKRTKERKARGIKGSTIPETRKG